MPLTSGLVSCAQTGEEAASNTAAVRAITRYRMMTAPDTYAGRVIPLFYSPPGRHLRTGGASGQAYIFRSAGGINTLPRHFLGFITAGTAGFRRSYTLRTVGQSTSSAARTHGSCSAAARHSTQAGRARTASI